MADNKTELPTPKRLREARRKGQISKSNDLTQAFLFLTAAVVLSILGGRLLGELRMLLLRSFEPKRIADISNNSLVELSGGVFLEFCLISAPLMAALVVVSVAVNFLQLGGVIFSGEALTFKPERINPMEGFRRIFLKSKSYVELVKNLLKFAAILWLAYSTFRGSLRDVVLIARLGLPQAAALTSRVLFRFLLEAGGAFLVIGAVDFLLQRHFYIKDLKMTKEEVKREYKEEEGDPHMKHQRRHLHRQILAQNMLTNVPNAKAVVVNPTHFAIALDYKENSMAAPQVAAKGQMVMAHKIVTLAKQHGVPIVRNIPLAHSLFMLDIGDEIPEELYQAVAEVLNWVQELARLEVP
jgi:flagellar biosynthetic protein FlhB